MIRISIVHPNSHVANCLARGLVQEQDMRIIYQIPTVNEALVRIGHDTCDVILASASLAEDDGIRLIRKLKCANIRARILVTDLPNEKARIMRYVLAGAGGYTLKGDGAAKIAEAICAVHEGQAIISDEVAALLMRQIAKLSLAHKQSAPCASAQSDLTTREQDVLQLLAQGHSNKAIAERLIISIGTAKNHVHNVLKKLNLRSRKEAARYVNHVNDSARFGDQRFAGQMI
ncbi:MAG: response regulator transcription factor [Caldilineaceae bacterium]